LSENRLSPIILLLPNAKNERSSFPSDGIGWAKGDGEGMSEEY
jgi:hypothetical protein